MYILTQFKRSLHLSIVLVFTFGFTFVKGQQFVDTTSKKKNVVLEEFTGSLCQYCPHGHKIASQIQSDNPNSVVLVKVHTGGYAQPVGGRPDYRTQFGEDLANKMNVEGYPTASISRRKFNFNYSTSDRSKWESKADEVRNETSPVNVAIQTNLNPDTRKLTVDVEVYYTDSSKGNTNKLNVALLQNNLTGPQIDGGDFYPENFLPNGEYIHQNMLRHFLTGQWGETINHPYEDSLFKKTYTYTIPEDYRSVPVKLQHLEVAAYVAEGKQNILTGVSQKLDVGSQNLTDLKVTQNSSLSGICSSKIKPSFKVTNKGDQAVDSFDAHITINGTEYVKTFKNSIAPGSSKTIVWSDLNLPGGSFTLRFKGISNLNGGDLFDSSVVNNYPKNFNDFSFLEDALNGQASASFNGFVAQHFALDKESNPSLQVVYNSQSAIGANESKGAIAQIVEPSQNYYQQKGHILFGKLNLSQVDNPFISFYFSYSKGNNSISNTPELKVEVSEDCGSTWKSVGTYTTYETVSFSPTQGSPYYIPDPADYKFLRFSLDKFKDKDDLIARVTINPRDGGNIVWLDEIKVGTKTQVTSIHEKDFESKASLYPNPVSSNATLRLDLEKSRNISGKIIDVVGNTVKTISPRKVSAGPSNISLDLSDLSPGVYSAQLNIDGKLKNIKFIVAE